MAHQIGSSGTFSVLYSMGLLSSYQEDEGGVSNQSDGSGELAFVSPAVGACWLVCVLGQLQLF